jgi:hypothetical protein
MSDCIGGGQVNGRQLANRITESIIGREVLPSIPYWKSVHFASWTVTGLTPDEVFAVRAALEPLREIEREQRKARRAQRATPANW